MAHSYTRPGVAAEAAREDDGRTGAREYHGETDHYGYSDRSALGPYNPYVPRESAAYGTSRFDYQSSMRDAREPGRASGSSINESAARHGEEEDVIEQSRWPARAPVTRAAARSQHEAQRETYSRAGEL